MNDRSGGKISQNYAISSQHILAWEVDIHFIEFYMSTGNYFEDILLPRKMDRPT